MSPDVCAHCVTVPPAAGGFLENLFSTDFVPRAQCVGDRAGIIWLHVLSDASIALAYYSIPIALVALVRKRRDLAFGWMFLLFGAFILACGTTHILSIVAFWRPVYRLDGVVKAGTGAISMATAVILWPLIPKALAIPSPKQLRELNTELVREVDTRRSAEAQLASVNQELEARVRERTEALAERVAELELVSDAAAVGLCMLDADGRVSRFNRAFASLRGLRDPPTLGAELATISPALAKLLREVPEREPIRARAVAPLEEESTDAHWLVSVQPVDSADHPGRSLAVLDASERVRLESQLRQSQKMDAIGQIASGVAHDVNNALTAIYGHLSFARAQLGAPERAAESLNQIEQAAEQAARITRSLLAFARPEPANREPVELAHAVAHALSLVRGMMPATIELKTDLSSIEHVWILADRTQIQQVLLNLAINARDAMSKGGTLLITGAADAQAVRIQVSDAGCGIPARDLSRIFDPFFTTKPRGQGTGLGLAMVDSIMRAHQGKVSVSSTLGVGTVFTLELPRTGEREHRMAAPTPSSQETHGTVVLADDNAQVRGLLAMQLDGDGFEVVQAGDGEEFVAACTALTRPARAYVVDIDMPKRSGLEALQELRSKGDFTPAILITGGRISGIVVDEHTTLLYKPFSREELLRSVGAARRK
jgi:signal transduction histidine kinase/CheY-like chemotaxis protein